jgi:hypothetical protein
MRSNTGLSQYGSRGHLNSRARCDCRKCKTPTPILQRNPAVVEHKQQGVPLTGAEWSMHITDTGAILTTTTAAPQQGYRRISEF